MIQKYLKHGLIYANSLPSTGERYDTILNSWVAIAPLNTPRRSLALGVLGGPMYALGGYDGASSLKSVERYDPQSNCWTKVSWIDSFKKIPLYNS